MLLAVLLDAEQTWLDQELKLAMTEIQQTIKDVQQTASLLWQDGLVKGVDAALMIPAIRLAEMVSEQ